MKLRASKEHLLQAIGLARHALGKGELTSRILIRVDNGRCELAATDYDLSVRAEAKADCERSGAWAVPGDLLAKVAAKLSDGAVVALSGDEGRVTLEQGRTRFELAAMPGDEFPDVGAAPAAPWQIAPAELAAMLRAAHCPATDDARPSICGVALICDGQRLAAVATDGFRLGICDKSNDEIEAPAGSCSVHRRALPAISALLALAPAGERISVCTAGRDVLFDLAGAGTIISRRIDAAFPDYKRVVPDRKGFASLTISREGLRTALGRVATVADREAKTGYVIAELEIDALFGLRLSARHAVFGSVTTEIEIDGYVGRQIRIGLNPNFALDALNSLTGEHVHVWLKDEMQPLLFTCDEDPANLQVVMPALL